MPRYFRKPEDLTIEESFARAALADLKPLGRAISADAPMRKGDLVPFLVNKLSTPERAEALYKRLDELGQAAVQEATHDPEGLLDLDRFRAKYGGEPNFGAKEGTSTKGTGSVPLGMFFPVSLALPSDLHRMLRSFVPRPQALNATASQDLPATINVPCYRWVNGKAVEETLEQPLRVRETARDALHDVLALLRLVDRGQVRVSEKTGRPSDATVRAVAGILEGGDFYSEADEPQDKWSVVRGLSMKAFAWPLLLQAGGLAKRMGTKLQLTPAGRKATMQPAAEAIRHLWQKWLESKILDEFSRIDVIKGQQSRGGLAALGPRRDALESMLALWPPGQWLAIAEVFRLLRAQSPPLIVTHNRWNLYLVEQQYGSLGYDGRSSWELIEGRYALAFLFEYAATLGIVDVAYIGPVGARDDYSDRWGADDFDCLSRYDGLQYARVNALGAWCLGTAPSYEPQTVPRQPALRVLPNLDVVARDRPLSAADRLLLERFAEPSSEAVWRLSKQKVLTALEEGLRIGELREFLTARSPEALPHTVTVFLDDLEQRARLLRDRGTARCVECMDTGTAQLLANERRLRGLCQLAGERTLVFSEKDETAVRRALRELGYVLTPFSG